MAVTAKARAQTQLGEKIIENAQLEALLEERAASGDRKKSATKKHREKDLAAKGSIEALGIAGDFRVGRWLISTEERPGGHVEFDTAPSKRIRIKPDGGE